MNKPIQSVSQDLQSAYNQQYSDSSLEWRDLGAKYKAENIANVCAGVAFQKALDCGAGNGSILKFLDGSSVAADLYALEISDSGISELKKRELQNLKEVKKFDGYRIPYPDLMFDMAYCSHVIEHVEHPRMLLRELARVSKYQVFEIPLDYAINADRDIQYFLSYGHINIYTPTLFKYLLKSEGFQIMNERFTNATEDVVRFNWYRNMGRKKTLANEIRLKLIPLRNVMKKTLYGRRRYEEYGYSAYTCLTKCTGRLEIFKSPAPNQQF